MTTLQIKTDLRLKIKEKSAQKLVSIYERNQLKIQAGFNLEDGMIINDICIEEMVNRLRKINFSASWLTDNQIYDYFKSKI